MWLHAAQCKGADDSEEKRKLQANKWVGSTQEKRGMGEEMGEKEEKWGGEIRSEPRNWKSNRRGGHKLRKRQMEERLGREAQKGQGEGIK